MKSEKYGIKKILFICTLLFTTLVMMAETPLTPASDILFKTFSNTSAVNLLLTIPTLMAMFASLFCGVLMLKTDKKLILLFGVICYCIGGICGHLIDSISYMIFMRAILGLGLGACNVSAIAIASEQSENENERQKILSYITAGISISAMILTFLSGQLISKMGWQSVFRVYWTGIPMLIMVLFFIPSSSKALKANSSITTLHEVSQQQEKIELPFYVQTGLQLFWFMTYGVVFFQIAVYSSERGIGDAAFAGTMSSVSNFIAFVASLSFPYIYHHSFKNLSSILHYALLSIGFLILLVFSSKTATTLACSILGFAFGYSLSFYSIHLGEIVPKSKESMAATVFSATMGIGMFLSAFAVSLLKSILDINTISGLLPYIIIIDILGTIISWLISYVKPQKS